MDKLQIYLQIIPLPVLVGVMAVAGLVWMMIPSSQRLWFMIALMPPWLFLSKCLDLGPIQAATKLSSGLMFLMVALAAWLRPVDRRPIPGAAWLYVAASLYMIACVIGTVNRTEMILLKGQYLALCFAAIMTVSTIQDLDDFARLMKSVAIGTTIAICIAAAGLFIEGRDAFVAGLHRFGPWGSAPNLIGITFAIAGGMLLYLILTTPRGMVRLGCMGLLGLDISFAFLTGSRMSFLSLAVICVLMLFPLVRRPGLFITGAVFAAGVLMAVSGIQEGAGARLMETHTSGRIGLWIDYLGLAFSRPLGLLGTSGNDGLMDLTINNHAHNAWIDMLYVGGFPLLLMLAIPAFKAAKAIWRSWRMRNLLPTNEQRLVVHTSASIMAAMFLQSMTNQTLYFPTYTWAFLGVVFFVFFMAWEEQDLPWVEEAWWDEAQRMEQYEGEFDDGDEQLAPA